MNRQRQFQVRFEVDGQGKVQAELESIARQGKTATERSRELSRAVIELGDRVDDAAARTRQYARDQALLDAALKGGVITAKEQSRLLKQAWEQTPDGQRWYELGETIGTAMKWAGAAAVVGMGLIVRETAQAQQELAQLREVVESTGQAAGYSTDRLVAMSDEFSQRLKVFSGGEIMSAQTRLLSYTNVVGEQFPRALQAAADMSVRYQMSIEQAAETVGKALQSPSKATQALARQGYEFSEAEVAKMKAMEDAGRVAEAQTYILEALEEGQRNAAQAAGETFTGALTGLRNTLQDLITGSDGSLDGATEAVNDLTSALNSQDVKDGFEALVAGITTTTAVALEGIGALIRYREAARLAAGADPSTASDSGVNTRQNQIADELNLIDLAQRGNLLQRFTATQRLAMTTNLASPSEWSLTGRAAGLRAEQDNLIIDQRRRANAGRTQQVDDWVNGALAASHSAATGGSGGAKDLIDPDLQKQIDQVKAQAEAYGLSRTALAELNRERALSAATNDTERAAINAAYATLIQRIDAEERNTKATRATTQAQREQQRARDALERQYQNLAAGLEQQIALHGETGEAARMRYSIENGALAALTPAQQQYLLQLAAQRDAQIEATRLQDEAKRVMEGVRTPLEALNAELAEYQRLLDAGAISQETHSRAVANAQGEYAENVERLRQQNRTYMEAMLEDWADLGAGIDYATAQAVDGLSQALTDLAVDGEADLERLGDSIIRTFTRVMMDKAVAGFFESMGGGGSTGGGFWAGVGNWISGMFGGNRASGGGVSGSRIYEVTEQGKPELLRQGGRTYLLPGQDGVVMPASQAAAPGYAAPAMAAGPMALNLTVHQNAEETRAEGRQGPGGWDVELWLAGKFNSHVATGKADGVMSQRFGLRAPGVARG